MAESQYTRTEKDRSTAGLTWLAGVIAQGPTTVRSLVSSGDVDRALGMARWLGQIGHPQAAALIEEAQQAIRITLRPH